MKNEIATSKMKVDEQLIADKFLPKAAILVTIAAGLLVFAYTTRFGTTPSNDQEIWGLFGDFLGGILNPLISFLTLMVATKVWQLQQRELVKTQQALKQQAETNELQRFENTLFKLIEHCHNSIKTYCTGAHPDDALKPKFSGIEAVEYFVSQLRIKEHSEGDLPSWQIENMIEECNAFGFYSTYVSIKYAYEFALRKCPITEKNSDYLTMTCMLLGDDLIYLSRVWSIILNDQDFLEILPKTHSKVSSPC